jgi:hypothetical protein
LKQNKEIVEMARAARRLAAKHYRYLALGRLRKHSDKRIIRIGIFKGALCGRVDLGNQLRRRQSE